jgi:hypothetical protein
MNLRHLLILVKRRSKGSQGRRNPKTLANTKLKYDASLVWLQNLNQWRLPNLFYPPSQRFSHVLDADNLSYGLKGLLI